MKAIIKLFFISAILLVYACKNEAKTDEDGSLIENSVETNEPQKLGQAFIEDDESKPNVLQIAIGSPDHTTLVAAVQAAELENSLVNAEIGRASCRERV